MFSWIKRDSEQAGSCRWHAVAGSQWGLVVTHQWFVVAGRRVGAVVQLPARATVVAETGEVAAEVGARLTGAHVTRRLLQVRVYLYLYAHTRRRKSVSSESCRKRPNKSYGTTEPKWRIRWRSLSVSVHTQVSSVNLYSTLHLYL